MPIAAGDGSGGGQSIDNSRAYSIDASGAQHGVAEQITAALHQYDAWLNRTLGARVDANRRLYR